MIGAFALQRRLGPCPRHGVGLVSTVIGSSSPCSAEPGARISADIALPALLAAEHSPSIPRRSILRHQAPTGETPPYLVPDPPAENSRRSPRGVRETQPGRVI